MECLVMHETALHAVDQLIVQLCAQYTLKTIVLHDYGEFMLRKSMCVRQ